MQFGLKIGFAAVSRYLPSVWRVLSGIGSLTRQIGRQWPRSGRHGLRPDRRHQRSDAQDAHHPLEIIGQHMQRHFGADILQSLHQEVG